MQFKLKITPPASPRAWARRAGAPGRSARRPWGSPRKYRGEEQAEERYAEHAEEHRRSERLPHPGARAGDDHERHDAEDKGDSRHEDGTGDGNCRADGDGYSPGRVGDEVLNSAPKCAPPNELS
jgi:hypothetical protein